jgi:hypoxanthine phosphoribosyltransferase
VGQGHFMPNIINLNWSDIDKAIDKICHGIKSAPIQPTLVVAIKNGGTYPAHRIADKLNCKYGEIRVSFYNGHDLQNTPSSDTDSFQTLECKFDWHKENILFVDDLVDSGRTFEYLETFLMVYEKKAQFACLYHPSKTLYEDNNHFVGELKPSEWLSLPWERMDETSVYEAIH